MTEDNVIKINIDLLLPNPFQPRTKINENSLKELALSIREYGIINPILVRPKNDKYEIIAGERRTRAAKLLNLTEIPAIVKNIDDEKMAEIALIENLQRENIDPIDEATTYHNILETTNKTEQELSEMIGKSQSFIANKLRLLKLPEKIKDALINRKISERHARSLLTVDNEEDKIELLEKVINEKLTVKELDNIIKEKNNKEDKNKLPINEDSQMNNKKEEKESDNMNNGSFFPNFNNSTNINNNPATLNSMNMQATNNFTYQPEQQTVESNMQQVTPQTPQAPIAEPQNSPLQPISNNMQIPPITNDNNEPMNFNMPTPSFNQPSPVAEMNPIAPIAPEPPAIEENNQMADIPLFNTPEFNQQPEQIVPNTSNVDVMSQTAQPVTETPTIEPLLQPEPSIPAMAPTATSVPEPPLFNQNLTSPSVDANSQVTATEPASFEVPVDTASNQDQVDKYTKVTEILNNNNISYKAYSNETGYCIIIEL